MLQICRLFLLLFSVDGDGEGGGGNISGTACLVGGAVTDIVI